MQAGDSTAVSDLASTYGPRIHQLAFRYLKNWEDAEEVTQDVLMKVHRKIDAFRGTRRYLPGFIGSRSIRRCRVCGTAGSAVRTRCRARRTGNQRPVPDPADWSSLADDQVHARADARTA